MVIFDELSSNKSAVSVRFSLIKKIISVCVRYWINFAEILLSFLDNIKKKLSCRSNDLMSFVLNYIDFKSKVIFFDFFFFLFQKTWGANLRYKMWNELNKFSISLEFKLKKISETHNELSKIVNCESYRFSRRFATKW